MSRTIQVVLLVEDNLGDARLMREMFNEPGSRHVELIHAECMADAEEILTERAVDIILLDLGLRDAQGLDAINRAHAAALHVPLVVLTGLDDETFAAQALQEGAQDYLIKGQIETRGLMRALRYAVERKIMEDALFAEKERAEVTLNCIGDAVACSDVSGLVTFLNLVAQKTTGWSLADALGKPMSDVVTIVDAVSRKATANPMERAIRQDAVVHIPSDCILIRQDESEVPIQDSVAPIHDREGRTTGAVIVFRDVSMGRAMAQQMAHSAHHDFLTGLPNRVLLNDRIGLAAALAARHGKKAAVLFLDLDGFKHINDSLGHQVGDKLLCSVAKRLSGSLRGSDTVSRQGGDEFVMLLAEIEHAEDAALAARRMLSAVAEAHVIDELELHITTSIGVSIYPDDGLDAETLIKNADTAMYQAKENGRQGYQFFEPAMNVRAVERQFIEEALRRALDRQEFALHYQPKINLLTGKIMGAEALIRWTHPTRGPVSPAEFIPVAEDSGLILPIGNWVLREACRQARVWLDAGLLVGSIAVNISAIELRSEGFLTGVFAALDGAGLDPAFLELELTESVLMKRAESTEAILKALQARGVQIAVDDFGTGYSSLSYLSKFSIDTLKIDQSFVRQISTTPDQTAIVTAVIGIGRSLKLRVVAEGVETVEELAFLRAHRCDEAQGYYFSRPLPAAQFARLLETGLPTAVLSHFDTALSGVHAVSGVVPLPLEAPAARQPTGSGRS
jgi:diguanylate cyclase (GGDEF)-like protein/PAS domain S-box-containing protein